MKKCVYAGTFDPPTTGHKQVIDSCLKIFDSVVVAVMINRQKTPLLSEDERVFLLKKLYADNPRVKVISFCGAAVDILEKENTPFYVRGVRDAIDFEYENRDFFASKKLKNDICAVYIPAPQEMLHVSSSLVKNCAAFGKDFSEYVPAEIFGEVAEALKKTNLKG